jgi:hypothetical protein
VIIAVGERLPKALKRGGGLGLDGTIEIVPFPILHARVVAAETDSRFLDSAVAVALAALGMTKSETLIAIESARRDSNRLRREPSCRGVAYLRR